MLVWIHLNASHIYLYLIKILSSLERYNIVGWNAYYWFACGIPCLIKSQRSFPWYDLGKRSNILVVSIFREIIWKTCCLWNSHMKMHSWNIHSHISKYLVLGGRSIYLYSALHKYSNPFIFFLHFVVLLS